jgi:Lon protease-like protein
MATLTIPLFPLHSVLFPGGPLVLRIFEPRYLDMVSCCLKDESGFGVVLIREGREVGEAPQVYEVGTFGHISYWEQRKDGLLGITVTGERRFRILQTAVQPNQLMTAEVELLSTLPARPLPKQHTPLASLLQRILDELAHPYITLERHYDDAEWVGGRLAELLPLDLALKQRLLQEDDPLLRLARLKAILDGQEGRR